MTDPALSRFAEEYARHRAAEGRQYGAGELLSLPWLRYGPLAGQWAVRARTYECFVRRILDPMAKEAVRPLHLLDLGAGNGWLSYRAALAGHRATAIDIRKDTIDGLGAASPLLERVLGAIATMAASFDEVALEDDTADLAVFNAALHYAVDLTATLREATRLVRPGGRVVILDSPFYRSEEDGLAMLTEKRASARDRFGESATILMGMNFIEFLTAERLKEASQALDLRWTRIRVRYPLAYEFRPLAAWLRGRRPPSRFDIWEAVVR